MPAKLSLTCSQCGHEETIALDAPRVSADRNGSGRVTVRVVEPYRDGATVSVGTSKPDPVCKCGHEKTWHDAKGCSYGRGTATGGCTCTHYHTRKLREPTAGSDDKGLGDYDHNLCSALVHFGYLSRPALALVSGYSHLSGAFTKSIRKLIQAGVIYELHDRRLGLTGELHFDKATYRKPMSKPERLEHWVSKVGIYAGTLLNLYVTAYPLQCPKGELAHASGYSATSGAFTKALRKLRKLGLVDDDRATDALMQPAGPTS